MKSGRIHTNIWEKYAKQKPKPAMDNILKFLIKLNADKGNVVSVARQTEQQLDTINRKASVVGRGLRRAFSFEGFKGSLMSIPGMSFLMNPYTMIGAGIAGMVRLGAQAEQTGVAFRVLVGDEEKATKMLSQITDLSARSPFSKLQLERNAQLMMNFGVASNETLKRLEQLGNISGGDAGRLSSLSLVLGQVHANGYLMGQDLLQFVNAGFNPLQELSKMTGKSMSELRELMSDGKITYQNIAQAIDHATGAGGKFNGMMDAQSQTVAGKWNKAVSVVQTKTLELYNSVKSPIGELLDLITAAIPKIFGIISALASALSSAIKFVVKFKTEFMVLGGIIATVWAVCRAYTMALAAYKAVMTVVAAVTKLWTAAQWLLNIAMDANPIGIVIAVIVALISVVVYCWMKFASFRAYLLMTWDTIKAFAGIIKDYLIARINELLTGIGKVAVALKKLFTGDFTGAARAFGEGMKNLSGIQSGTTAIGQSLNAVRGIKGNFIRHYAAEQAKDKEEEGVKSRSALAVPRLKGSAAAEQVVFGDGKGKKGKGKKGRKSAEDIATGGRRNTSITMHIGKFFDTLHVHMTDKADTAELERIVIQSMNRALAIATSTDRG